MSLWDHVWNELLDDDTTTCTVFSTTIPFVHETFCSLVKDNHAIWSVALVEVLYDLNCCSERYALNLANKISTYQWKSKIFARGPSKTGYESFVCLEKFNQLLAAKNENITIWTQAFWVVIEVARNLIWN